MSDEDLLLSAELTKTNILLEHLWTELFVNHGATPEAVTAAGADVVQKFEDQAVNYFGAAASVEERRELQSLTAERLTVFFARLRARFEASRSR